MAIMTLKFYDKSLFSNILVSLFTSVPWVILMKQMNDVNIIVK